MYVNDSTTASPKGIAKGDFVEVILPNDSTNKDNILKYTLHYVPCGLKNCVYLPDNRSVLYEVENDMETNTNNIQFVNGPGCVFSSNTALTA